MSNCVRLLLSAVLLTASTGSALERTARPVSGDGRGDWGAGGLTCTIQYYNICTGWVMVQGGYDDGDRIGTVFESCAPGESCTLHSSFMFFVSAAPAGRGYAGIASVYAADANDCPTGPPLASQPLFPDSFWNLVNWGGVVVPDRFIVTYEYRDWFGIPSPVKACGDHPSAGPTGPQACGACYPTTRVNHSYYYGTAASPLCPGSEWLYDGVCDSQLLWDAALSCASAVAPDSWSSLKDLYR